MTITITTSAPLTPADVAGIGALIIAAQVKDLAPTSGKLPTPTASISYDLAWLTYEHCPLMDSWDLQIRVEPIGKGVKV